jgi:hypothetical protein
MATARIIKDDQLLRKDRFKRAGMFFFVASVAAVCLKVNTVKDDARQILTHELHSLGSAVDRELRDRITTIHGNATALDNQSKTLRNKTNQLAKTTKQWGGMADSARGKLKVRSPSCFWMDGS